MVYRKRYARRSRGGRDKYSMENRFINITVTDQGTENVEPLVRYQGIWTLVPATTVQGMRKVKHITLQLASSQTERFFYAVVYVPNATTPNQIGLVAYPNILYEPSQFLMGAGRVDPDAGTNRIRIPTSRNLNEGDQVVLIVGMNGTSEKIEGMATYAITYN